MAIDTEQKRRAAAVMFPGLPVVLKPDGTISDVDRQQIGWGYPGIATSAVAVAEVSERFILDGTDNSRLLLDGTNNSRLTLDGTSNSRITLVGTQ